MKEFCVNSYFYALAFSPILAFLLSAVSSVGYYNIIGFIGQILLVILVFEKVISSNLIKVPLYIYPLIMMGGYSLVWGFYNGMVQERGLVMHFFNNQSLKIAMLLLVIENHRFDAKYIKIVFFLLKLTLLIAAVFTIIQLIYTPYFATNIDYIRNVNNGFYEIRRRSIFGFTHKLDVGMSLVPIFSIVLSALLYFKTKITAILPYFLCASIVCFGFNSRWVLLNFAVVTLLIVMYSKNKMVSLQKYILVLIVLTVSYVFLISLSGEDFGLLVQNRLNDSDNGRLDSIRLFWYFFSQNPVFGRGFHITDEHSFLLSSIHQIHIGYLAFLDNWGFVGGLFQFSFWGLFVMKLYQEAKISNYWGAFMAFLTFLIANLTLVDYWIFHYGLILSFVFHRYFVVLSRDGVGAVNN